MNLIYIIIFFISIFTFSFIERKIRIPFAKWIFIIPFALIIANRSVSVPDTDSYILYYQQESSDLTQYVNYGFEIGFQTFTKISKFLFGEDYKLYFAFIAIVNLLLVDISIKRIIRHFISAEKDEIRREQLELNWKKKGHTIIHLTLYVAFFGLYFNAIVLRVGMAMSLILLIASIAIKPKKNTFNYISIVLLSILAYLFHATAILGIIILFIILFSKDYSKKFYIVAWLLIGFIYFTNIFERLGGGVFNSLSALTTLQALNNKLNSYDIQSMMVSQGISMKFLFFWGFSLLLALTAQIKGNRIYFKYVNVLFTGILLFAIFRSILLLERVTDYFTFFSFAIFSMFLFIRNSTSFFLYYTLIVIVQLIFVLRITGVTLS